MSGAQRKNATAADGGEVLLEAIADALRAHIVMSDSQVVAVGLWILFTHLHEAVSVSPLLRITSQEKRSGKTSALMLISSLVRHPLPASSISTAALYHTIDEQRPTLLLDETEHWLHRNPQMTAVINAGHYRHTARLIRCAGKKNRARAFSTWCPKLVCGIGDLPDTMTDRSIVIVLRRKFADETKRPLRGDVQGYAPLASQITKWASKQIDPLKAIDPVMPAELNDRAADNWRPLLAIAELVGGEWPARARSAAAALTPSSADDDSEGIRLLRSIAHEIACRQDDEDELTRSHEQISSEELVRLINQDEVRLERGDRRLTTTALARRLSGFGVYSRNIRWAERYPGSGERLERQAKGYLFESFMEAFARYIPHVFKAQTTGQPATPCDETTPDVSPSAESSGASSSAPTVPPSQSRET